ncbi:MAG: amidohydrolase family protein, partial [Lachnospiraceae bacterium]|nr:amidohydrolase family protein [Lachnospiraceae bacterium]
ESEAVNRYLTIAHEAGTPVNIVHLSTKQSMDFVRMARDKGQIVCVETCPQYFFLDDSMYDLPDFEGAKYVFSPPARKKEDQDALWDAIRHGEVDTIGTDHCSFNFATEKILGIDDFASIPNGIPGTEHRPVLMYTYGVLKGRMTNQAFCRLLSENAAKQFGMYPQKGAIQEGSDADIVVWDPNCAGVITAEKQIQAVDYTPYEGMEIKGAPSLVFLHGQLAAKDGQVVRKGLGRYVSRKAADLSFRKN